ncbi:TPR-like protein [Dichomitus squalens LYAD-421 SS1]|uniref:RNA polymerase II-associated protein 3 n=1 Tax=Dichomitus squalens TaxID=114155 RepID=A0A4Q9QFR1_9APHY|nr:TPR-like protein [Dichomitus squalens LYAD-421 SS1]EJF65951.1 TPR-like protein [Dichomitus squalens LYAD-421 SS1]TBU65724.1 TPR-like protein [Dichomitus squalens]
MADVALKEKEKVRRNSILPGGLGFLNVCPQGNAAFKAGDFPTAIGHYTAAYIADPSNATYPLNRAAAYLKLGKNEDAERDCETVIRLDKKNVKGYFRRGQARVALQRLKDAEAGAWCLLAVDANAPKREIPQTLIAFTRIWDELKTEEERWDVLRQIPATRLPMLFKTSLSASILAAILRSLRSALEGVPEEPERTLVVRAYMVNLPRVPRFSTVSMMMSADERADAQVVWDLLGRSRGDGVEGEMDKRKEDGSRSAWGCH